MKVQGPDFIALQWQDLDAAKRFYHETLGLELAPQSPPDAVVFKTVPVPFAVRKPIVDLDATPYRGHGIALWLKANDSGAVLEHLKSKDIEIVKELENSPFGKTFTFKDPEGYFITVHDES